MPEAKLNDINLYYKIHGEGEPLLLLPGLGCDNQAWLPVSEDLSNRFRIIAPDNRGAGLSDVPTEPYTISDMADDAAGLLAHLKVDSAHVIGHSMGGISPRSSRSTIPTASGSFCWSARRPSPRREITSSSALSWSGCGRGWVWMTG